MHPRSYQRVSRIFCQSNITSGKSRAEHSRNDMVCKLLLQPNLESRMKYDCDSYAGKLSARVDRYEQKVHHVGMGDMEY